MWNPFSSKKSTQQEFQELLDALDISAASTPQLTPTTITSGTLPIGTLPIGAGTLLGGVLPSSATTSITIPSLSKEEREELDGLKIEHTHQIKRAKSAVFRKLPPEMRQFVINALTWQTNLKEIENTSTVKSPRLVELEIKDMNSKMFSSTGAHTLGSLNVNFSQMFNLVGIPEGITADDLKEAHLEATLEEEMLNGEKEE